MPDLPVPTTPTSSSFTAFPSVQADGTFRPVSRTPALTRHARVTYAVALPTPDRLRVLGGGGGGRAPPPGVGSCRAWTETELAVTLGASEL